MKSSVFLLSYGQVYYIVYSKIKTLGIYSQSDEAS